MPHIFVSVVSDGANGEPDIKDYELSLDFTIGDLKGLIEAETGLPTARQLVFFNGQPLGSDSQSLQAAGVKDQDMLLVNQREHVPSSQPSNAQTSDAHTQIEGLRQQLLNRTRNAPQDRAQLQREVPGLLAALDDPAQFREAFYQQQARQNQQRQQHAAELEALNNDMSEESQAKIYEAIRQERVAAEAEKAMEEHPELFGRVTMLYVNVQVNGHPVKAFVDSGAQATIMSPSCAENCNVTKSIDTRFAGVARGVGTAKILGRVHSATMKIGDYELPCAFTVMEGKDVDLLLGLDMLKRYQASIDLLNNKLVLGGAVSVPFLDEAEIPKSFEEAMDNEATIPGPGGASIGAESGALKPPSSSTSSSAKAASNFAGQGRTIGPTTASSPSSSTQPTTQSVPPSTPSRLQQPPRPTAPTPGGGQFPEKDIEMLVGLGASREEAIEALRACNGNLEYAAGMFYG